MPDLLYISEVGNYLLLNASFRIEWPVTDQESVFFLSVFVLVVLYFLGYHNCNVFRKFIDVRFLSKIYLASFGIICLISLSILVLANLTLDFLLF